MERIVIASAVLIVAVVIAVVLDRRRPDVPTRVTWPIPVQVDRSDFAHADAPWLIVLFSSSTCASCERVRALVDGYRSDQIAVQDVDEIERKDLHRRYGIEAVPLIIVVDDRGVVRASHVGVPAESELDEVLTTLE